MSLLPEAMRLPSGLKHTLMTSQWCPLRVSCSCPVAASLEILGERWSLLAIREMSYGVHRFDQIAGYTGASRDILADRLRRLVANGLLWRTADQTHRQKIRYSLTEAGIPCPTWALVRSADDLAAFAVDARLIQLQALPRPLPRSAPLP